MNAHAEAASSTRANEALRHTPFADLHGARGAKMVPFAGYEMPLHYRGGVLAEHLHTRRAAGLFDVSHMGQLELSSVSGGIAEVAHALEALIPADIIGLKAGRQRYGLLLNEGGGIKDDLMVMNLGERIILVVNAATKAADAAYLREKLPRTVDLAVVGNALIALQGPKSEAVLARLLPAVATMRFMDAGDVAIRGAPCVVTRSGYTGEDGFEISLPEDRAAEIVETLLSDEAVMPVGLGARDTLRLEAGLCLYGADMDDETSPVEAGLTWTIPPVRCEGGARRGGFPGADRVLREVVNGTSRRRVGLRPEGRVPVRPGAILFKDDSGEGTSPIGKITSGGFGPSLGAPIAMGYLPSDLSAVDRLVFAEVRGQRLPLRVARLPFVPVGFKRT